MFWYTCTDMLCDVFTVYRHVTLFYIWYTCSALCVYSIQTPRVELWDQDNSDELCVYSIQTPRVECRGLKGNFNTPKGCILYVQISIIWEGISGDNPSFRIYKREKTHALLRLGNAVSPVVYTRGARAARTNLHRSTVYIYDIHYTLPLDIHYIYCKNPHRKNAVMHINKICVSLECFCIQVNVCVLSMSMFSNVCARNSTHILCLAFFIAALLRLLPLRMSHVTHTHSLSLSHAHTCVCVRAGVCVPVYYLLCLAFCVIILLLLSVIRIE